MPDSLSRRECEQCVFRRSQFNSMTPAEETTRKARPSLRAAYENSRA
jgi:hypothetical protein